MQDSIEDLLSSTTLGWSKLHEAGKLGTIGNYAGILKENRWALVHEMPFAENYPISDVVKSRYNMCKCSVGNTVLSVCINHKNLASIADMVDTQLLSTFNAGCSGFHRAAITGTLQCVAKYLTAEALLSPCEGKERKNVIALAAEFGHFGQVPSEYVTAEILSLPVDISNNTLYHVLAMRGDLDLVPEGLLDRGLSLLNHAGESPLHYCAWTGNFGQVPEAFLTSERIEQRPVVQKWNSLANILSPLEYAQQCHHLDALLGIEFSEGARQVVGEDWWNKNRMVIQDKRALKDGNAAQELELF